MAPYAADIQRIIYSANGVSYLLTVHLVDASGAIARTAYGGEKELCKALEQLNVPALQQDRIVSVLRSIGRETVPLDISGEDFTQFYQLPPELKQDQ